MPERLAVLHRDARTLVVSKPSGLAVHRGWDADPVSLVALVRNDICEDASPVHRLDRGTSGAVLFALDAAAAREMQERFQSGAVRKRYLVLVRGVTPPEGRIDHPIPRAPKGPRVGAVTTFRRLAVALDRYSLLEAEPLTGRLHQIRRHLKHLSHPVIGDSNYGDLRENRALRERFGLARLALHAMELAFDSLVNGAPIAVRAPLPPDLRAPLEAMGLPAALG